MGLPVHKADNLTATCEPTAYKMWEPLHLTTLWAFTTCYRDSFTFTLPTGMSFTSLALSFWILHPYGKSFTKLNLGIQWKTQLFWQWKLSCSAEEFYEKLNFPICEGCTDGLHDPLQGLLSFFLPHFTFPHVNINTHRTDIILWNKTVHLWPTI
jgi:hypothetical protein